MLVAYKQSHDLGVILTIQAQLLETFGKALKPTKLRAASIQILRAFRSSPTLPMTQAAILQPL